jgi:phage tail-like protein
MATPTPTYFLLDSQQRHTAEAGWQVQSLTQVTVTPEGLQLAPRPAPPVPLKDAAGTYGGLTNPTGVAIAAAGGIYIADATHHQIFKLTRREQMQVWATFFRVGTGAFASDRFVYLPTATRLERWRPAPEPVPQQFEAVEVISETVWSVVQAQRLVLCYVQTQPPDSSPNPCAPAPETPINVPIAIAEIWEAPYPAHLPAGKICQSSINYLPCLGGKGSAPRQFDTPRGLAISASGNLYVADTQNHRIQVFSLPTLTLQAIWGKRAGTIDLESLPALTDCVSSENQPLYWGQPIAGSGLGEFNEPWDVVVDDQEIVYIADTKNRRLQKFTPRTQRFEAIDGTQLQAHVLKVLYGKGRRDRFLFIPARQRLERWAASLGRDPTSTHEITVLSTAVSTLEAARQLVLETLNAKGAMDLLVEWQQDYPTTLETDPAFEQPTHLAIDHAGLLYVVDQARPEVTVLDCWGRVVRRISDVNQVGGTLPPTAITVDASGNLILANSTGLHRFDLRQDGRYDGCCTSIGHCTGMAPAGEHLIVVTGEGHVAQITNAMQFEPKGTYVSHALDSGIDQCAWHKLILESSIPTGTRITVWTYTAELDWSPADIAALQPEDWQTGQVNGNDFLVLSPPGRFLWLRIEFAGSGTATPTLKRLKAYFPRLTYLQYLPAVYQSDPISKDFLERYLSIFETVLGSVEGKVDRLANYFDPDGVPDRAFLEWLAAWVDMSFYTSWSLETSRRLLRHAAELYRLRGTPTGLKRMLELAFGVKAEILEHFCQRSGEFLNHQLVLGERSHLWGNVLLDRFSLGDVPLGELPLAGNAPPVDRLSQAAHQFSVFIPAVQVRSPTQERQIRALIDAEKPGHTQYTLFTVEPRLQVGMQSRLGMNMLVGAYPRLVLNHCSTLGADTILNRTEAPTTPLQVGLHQRIGINAVVR